MTATPDLPPSAAPETVVELCSAALAERPDDAAAAASLGAVLDDADRLARAIDALSRATRPGAIAALGLVRQVLGDRDAARAAYHRAVELDPVQLVALRGLLAIARNPIEAEEATALMRSALAHDPEHALILGDLGAQLYNRRRYAQALPLLERAVAQRPDVQRPARQCFYIHQELGAPERARAVYARHLCHRRDPVLDLQSATLLPPIPDSAAHLAEWRQRFRDNVAALAEDPPRLADPARGFARSLFLLAYHGLDDRALRVDLARLYRRACPALDFTAPHCRERRGAGRKIRLGLVSSFFRDHTIGKLNLGFVRHLPRDRFEVTVFAVPGVEDATTAQYRTAADRFVTLPPRYFDARQAIADSAQDSLLYPELGMEAFAYMLAFARLAPLQLTTWGHPETSGIDTVDAFLSSTWLEPPGAESAYAERLVRLPALPAAPAAPEAKRRFAREHFGLAEDRRVYACPQTLFKFHPNFDPVLAEILARDPDGLLVLLQGQTPEWAERLAGRFRRAGIDVDRQVRFLPPMPLDQYLSLCRLADVVLDPTVFGGGNSSFEAFHQDAAVVTQESGFLRGRITGGMYRKMGLAEMIAPDARGYVDAALRLAQDRDVNRAARARIAERRHLIYAAEDGAKALAAYLEEAVGRD